MRTTLTLDDDVSARLEQLRRQRQLRWREVVNQALRIGLDHLEETGPRAHAQVVIQPVSLGPRITDLDDIAGILSATESDGWR